MLLWCISIILTNIFVISKTEFTNTCEPKTIRNYEGMVCSNMLLKVVPQDINSKIEALDLSANLITDTKLTSTMMERYGDLKFLNLSYNHISEIDNTIFIETLSSVEILDLSYLHLNSLPNLPKSLTELYLDYNIELFKGSINPALSFKEQRSLRVLSLNENKLKKFPEVLYAGGTLEELYLQNNLFKNFTIKDLAPLCRLKTLTISPDDVFLSSNDYCYCWQVEKWAKEYDITIDGLSCRKPTSDSNEIDCYDIPVPFKDIRHECLTKGKFKRYLIIGASIAVGFIVVCVIVICYLRRRKRKSAGKKYANDDSL